MPKEQVSQEVTAEVTGAPKSKGPIKPSVPESLKKTIIKKKNPVPYLTRNTPYPVSYALRNNTLFHICEENFNYVSYIKLLLIIVSIIRMTT